MLHSLLPKGTLKEAELILKCDHLHQSSEEDQGQVCSCWKPGEKLSSSFQLLPAEKQNLGDAADGTAWLEEALRWLIPTLT